MLTTSWPSRQRWHSCTYNIVGQVQQGSGGFGFVANKPQWYKSTPAQHHTLAWSHSRPSKRTGYKVHKDCHPGKAGTADVISVSKEVEDILERPGDMEALRSSLIIRATYNVLPSSKNLSQCYGKDLTWPLCPIPQDAMGEVWELTRIKYAVIMADAEQHGRRVRIHSDEVGCRAFVTMSTTRHLIELGVWGQAHWQAIKALSKVAEKSS